MRKLAICSLFIVGAVLLLYVFTIGEIWNGHSVQLYLLLCTGIMSVNGSLLAVGRIRAEKPTWPQGTLPKFFADLRNRGELNRRIALEHESWQFEIDGKWHPIDFGIDGDRRTLPLGPGQEQRDLEVWILSDGSLSRKLKALAPGKHTLRVARLFHEGAFEDRLRVISNPIEIQITSTTENVEEPAWGDPDRTDDKRASPFTALEWEVRDHALIGYESGAVSSVNGSAPGKGLTAEEFARLLRNGLTGYGRYLEIRVPDIVTNHPPYGSYEPYRPVLEEVSRILDNK